MSTHSEYVYNTRVEADISHGDMFCTGFERPSRFRLRLWSRVRGRVLCRRRRTRTLPPFESDIQLTPLGVITPYRDYLL